MAPGKKILALGATGPTGLLFVAEALAGGHQLTLYVRNPSKLSDEIRSNSNVKIIHGELSNTELLSSAVEGQDVVVSVLGPNQISLKAGTFTDAYRVLFAAMRKYNVKRIFGLGTFSIVDPKDKRSLSTRLTVALVWGVANAAYNEIVAVGKVFDDEAGGLDWTLYRVGGLGIGSDTKVTATYVGWPEYASSVNRLGIAKWLVEQLESSEPQYLHEKPCLCTSSVRMWDIRV